MRSSDAWKLTKTSFSDFSADNASRLAAALAYYTIFALAPLLVIAVAALGFVSRGNMNARQKVIDTFTHTSAGIDPKTIGTLIDNASKHGSGILATIISTALALYAAYYFFTVVQGSLNTIWEVQPRSDVPWWKILGKRLLSLLLVGLVALLLVASLIVTTALTGFAGKLLGGVWGKALGFGVDVIGSLGIYTVLFATVYRFLPDVQIRWKDVWVGAALTAVLFVLGKYGLSLYFSYSSSASVFGVAGSLAALLLWVYYSAQIFFLGAEFTQAYARFEGKGLQPDEDSVKVAEIANPRPGPSAGTRHGEPLNKSDPDQRAPTGPPKHRAPRDSHRNRPIVIERPVNRLVFSPDAASKLLAAGGVGAGLLLGAISAVTSRRKLRQRLEKQDVPQRLGRVEERLRTVEGLHLSARKLDIDRRLAATDLRIRRAVDALKT